MMVGKTSVLAKVKVGSMFSTLYPKHGKLNILKKYEGEVVGKNRDNQNGLLITIRTKDGYRSLLADKMINPTPAKV